MRQEPRVYKLPLEMLYHWEATSPERIYLRQPFPGSGYKEYSFHSVADQVRRIAAAIKAHELPPGSNIAIFSKNCAHWMMADLAIWMAGHVSVPLYPNLSESTLAEILNHSETRLAFVGKLDNGQALRKAIPSKIPCISFPYEDFPNCEKWDELLTKFEPLHTNPTRGMSELATIIYTSGTTGEPKGVMHPFSSFAIAGTEILGVVPMTQDDRFFSYLPLAHVAERLLVETVSLYGGTIVSFAESIETFQHNLQSVQPCVFLSVPRLWQKFQSGILEKLPQKRLSLLLKIPVVSNLIKKKLKAALGLTHARIIITGAAPTPASLIEWYAKIGIEIQEAFGMTENFAYSHMNQKGRIKIGTVGQPWPLVKTRISPDGEIQIASPCDFRGYYHSSQKRAESFDGEYLKTGDRGSFDEEGFLKITGRTKDLFKTSKGKYVAPSPIESKVSTCDMVETVCIVGSNMPQPMGLVVLSGTGKNAPKDTVQHTLNDCLDRVNETLDPHEKVSKLVVMKDSWTVENGLLTPTLKVKRNLVEDKFGPSLEKWSQSKENVIWE